MGFRGFGSRVWEFRVYGLRGFRGCRGLGFRVYELESKLLNRVEGADIGEYYRDMQGHAPVGV